MAPELDSAVVSLIESWLGAVEADFTRRAAADPATVVGELTSLARRLPDRCP